MSTQRPHIRLMISGGGTGGHVYPAIAIADAVRTLDTEAAILFVGAKGRMEMQKVPQAGYDIEGLWISGLQRRLTLQNLSFPFKVLHSSWKAAQLINTFRPDVVVGVGGYASGPLLRMATWKGVPTLLQEQNGYAGLTNKLLASKASTICVAYANMERYFPKDKIKFTGNPVRTDIQNLAPLRQAALAHYSFSPHAPTLLVFGGSLGARTFNECMEKGVQALLDEGVQVIWQTGMAAFDALQSRVPAHPKLALVPFIEKMHYAYACADLVVARAGALSISELCLAEKASILVPSPYVAEDHQTKNARALVEQGAACLVTDRNAPTDLLATVRELLADETRRRELSTQIARFGRPNAARDIAAEIFRLAHRTLPTPATV